MRDLPKGVYPHEKKFRAGVKREGKLRFGPARVDVAAAEKDTMLLSQLRGGAIRNHFGRTARSFKSSLRVPTPVSFF